MVRNSVLDAVLAVGLVEKHRLGLRAEPVGDHVLILLAHDVL